jgi:hypothetical protein
MPFIQNILKYKSISIVGMAKNTGKTTCLNYVLERLAEENRKIAVTSIGVDGEERDILYNTLKPRISLKKGTIFMTSEQHFAERELTAEILEISKKTTALGHLIVAKAKTEGKIILSGPSDTNWLQESINLLHNFGAEICLVDGALSRVSLASPAITDAMILCTGATCSIQLENLTKKVKFLCEMINLPKAAENIYNECRNLSEGFWAISNEGKLVEKISNSLLITDEINLDFFKNYKQFFIYGALTDELIKTLNKKVNVSEATLIVRDFSKVFVKPNTYDKFSSKGGKIQVLQNAKLLAICTNPTSPEGYNYEPEILRNHIENELQIPTFDIMQTIKKRKIN